MSKEKEPKKLSLVSAKALLAALIFGLIAYFILLLDLHIPILGTGTVTDPREIFTTLGAALSGPIGGVLIGILAGIASPDFQLASIFVHIIGGVWVGISYKKLVQQKPPISIYLLGWASIILIYYYIFLIPSLLAILPLFSGEKIDFISMYINLAQGVLPEALLTTGFTTLVLFALPRKYRQPLW